MELTRAERQIDCVGIIVGTRTDEHFVRSQIGIGPESAGLFGQLRSNLDISDSDAGLKEEN